MMTKRSHPLKGRRVLIVEDQYLVADEVRRIVSELGGEIVGPVSRTATALEIISEAGCDLALLDINLGPENVYSLAAELRRRETPFIFVTGYEPWVIPEDFRDAPRLDKPLSPKNLEVAVMRLGC